MEYHRRRSVPCRVRSCLVAPYLYFFLGCPNSVGIASSRSGLRSGFSADSLGALIRFEAWCASPFSSVQTGTTASHLQVPASNAFSSVHLFRRTLVAPHVSEGFITGLAADSSAAVQM